MKRLMIVVAFAALSGGGFTSMPVKPEGTATFVGQHVIVEGVATVTPSSDRFGIDVALDGHAEDAPLFGFIENENVAQFPDLGRFDGKRVDVDGVVELYRGVPEIILTSRGQLRMAQ